MREQMRFNAKCNNQSLLSLTIAPTTACNFDCPYCFEPKKKPKTVSDDVIEEIVQFVKRHEEARYLRINWYGGEPLLAFDKMKKIYERLSKIEGKSITEHTIVTNGYLVDKDVVEFFKETGLGSIQITLDGPKERHDTSRCLKSTGVGTFDRIVSSIGLLSESLPDAHISVRVNIDKSNYKDFVKVRELLMRKYPDRENLSFYPGLIRRENEDGCSLCQTSYRQDEVIDLHNSLRKEGLDIRLYPSRLQRGCMMHDANSYIIGPEGEIYKCWNDVSEPSRIIGNIRNDSMSNEPLFVKYMIGTLPFNDECRECSVFPICEAGCPHYRYRNLYEGAAFTLCSPYKDRETLINSLLAGIIPENSRENVQKE